MRCACWKKAVLLAGGMVSRKGSRDCEGAATQSGEMIAASLPTLFLCAPLCDKLRKCYFNDHHAYYTIMFSDLSAFMMN